MRLKSKGEIEKPRAPGRDTAASRENRDLNRLTRRLHKEVVHAVNVNESMSCSRLRSFIGH